MASWKLKIGGLVQLKLIIRWKLVLHYMYYITLEYYISPYEAKLYLCIISTYLSQIEDDLTSVWDHGSFNKNDQWTK